MSVFPDWSGKTEGTPLQLARTSEDASFLKPELNNDSEQWHIITNNSVLWLFILSEVEKSDILQACRPWKRFWNTGLQPKWLVGTHEEVGVRYLTIFPFRRPFYWQKCNCLLKCFKHFLTHLFTDGTSLRIPTFLNILHGLSLLWNKTAQDVQRCISLILKHQPNEKKHSHSLAINSQTAGKRSSESMWSPLTFTARSPSELKQHLLGFGVRSKSPLCVISFYPTLSG